MMVSPGLEVKKNRHRWRFVLVSAGISFCCYVNRPLLHRLWVGIAKVKKAGKEVQVHGQSSVDFDPL